MYNFGNDLEESFLDETLSELEALEAIPEPQEAKEEINFFSLTDCKALLEQTDNLLRLVKIHLNSCSDYELFQLVKKYHPRLKWPLSRETALCLLEHVSDAELVTEGYEQLKKWSKLVGVGVIFRNRIQLMGIFGGSIIEPNLSIRLKAGVIGEVKEKFNGAKLYKEDREARKAALAMVYHFHTHYAEQLYKAGYNFITTIESGKRNNIIRDQITKFEQRRKAAEIYNSPELKDLDTKFKILTWEDASKLAKKQISGFHLVGQGEKKKLFGQTVSEQIAEYDLVARFGRREK